MLRKCLVFVARNRWVYLFLLFTVVRVAAQQRRPVPLVSVGEDYYRPAYHFTPPRQWMNDPNGLVYYKGTYHLFYQYHPQGNTWGPMHWGHATSTDLFNWQDQPIALYPNDSGTIFSGSAVADIQNTAGFKRGTEDPLVAIYTLNAKRQHQSLAYSTDGGKNWNQYAGNPVLPNPGQQDFRDPKVMWHAPSAQWVMTLAVGQEIRFYGSPNLREWKLLSRFGEGLGAKGGVWECPDLFELPVEGTNAKKWVLLVSINPGGPNGGSATQYFTGYFDGRVFTADDKEVRWMDFGTDNYAGVTYSNVPAEDGRRILIGWMSNWAYAQQTPTSAWRSTMTVPRELTLRAGEKGYSLCSAPVKELEQYRAEQPEQSIDMASAIVIPDSRALRSGACEIRFQASLNGADSMVLQLGNAAEQLAIKYDKRNSQLIIDRSRSGKVGFQEAFANRIYCPFVPKPSGSTSFRLLIDKTSLELFVDGGERVMTALFFPEYQYHQLQLQGIAREGSFRNFSITALRSSLLR